MTEENGALFQKWWDDHGQYVRAGGGQYEVSFAHEAWQHQQSRIDALTEERDALRAQLGQGEVVAYVTDACLEWMKDKAKHIDGKCQANWLTYPRAEYCNPLYTAPQSKPVTELEKERDGWKWQSELHKSQRDDAREQLNTMLLHQRNDVWCWMGDGTDGLDSMSNGMVVVIRANVLRNLIKQPAKPVDEREASVDDVDAWNPLFVEWWDKHGQFVRAGGGDYEISFAFEAWRYLYPQLIQARAALGGV